MKVMIYLFYLFGILSVALFISTLFTGVNLLWGYITLAFWCMCCVINYFNIKNESKRHAKSLIGIGCGVLVIGSCLFAISI